MWCICSFLHLESICEMFIFALAHSDLHRLSSHIHVIRNNHFENEHILQFPYWKSEFNECKSWEEHFAIRFCWFFFWWKICYWHSRNSHFIANVFNASQSKLIDSERLVRDSQLICPIRFSFIYRYLCAGSASSRYTWYFCPMYRNRQSRIGIFPFWSYAGNSAAIP